MEKLTTISHNSCAGMATSKAIASAMTTPFAFFHCPRFHEERKRLQQVLQEVIDPENIVRLMLETAGNWMAEHGALDLFQKSRNIGNNFIKIDTTYLNNMHEHKEARRPTGDRNYSYDSNRCCDDTCADLFSAQCPLFLCHSLCASASVTRRLQHLNNKIKSNDLEDQSSNNNICVDRRVAGYSRHRGGDKDASLTETEFP
ncbi:unnamed protein product [Trichogramma brassicae]|uniref:Uncharacterized protein n=1 Tax=Trichogramma brassicae TaxID=86971 RepID=A0A6H5I5R1_9HYME|nr:unnamed protein product [Trichogramma brassicae]